MAKMRPVQGVEKTGPEADLSKAALPKRNSPEYSRERLLRAFDIFVRVYPDHVDSLMDDFARIALQTCRPASKLRDLNGLQAAHRIGIDDRRVYALYHEGRFGACVDGKPRFRERVCGGLVARPGSMQSCGLDAEPQNPDPV